MRNTRNAKKLWIKWGTNDALWSQLETVS